MFYYNPSNLGPANNTGSDSMKVNLEVPKCVKIEDKSHCFMQAPTYNQRLI